MTLKEALDSYQFDNVGQFNGIARSLGYQTEYKDSYFRFRKDGEETVLHIDQIRALAEARPTEAYVNSLRNVSPEFSIKTVPTTPHTLLNWSRRISASSGGKT